MPTVCKKIFILLSSECQHSVSNVHFSAVTNCTAERSFSCLKRVKSYLCSSMTEDRLNNLAILSIESETLSTLNTDDLITDFAMKNVRQI